MEAATSIEVEQDQPLAPAAALPAREMFRFSEFVDVGQGASECEHARAGECRSIEHFHAWVRLPNSYQHEDIRGKALAAKARLIRELKDPNSDQSVIIDQTLADLDDPAFTDTLIDELVGRDWAEDYLEAQRDVEEREEFEHITQDREEFTRLGAQNSDRPEDEQSAEYRQLAAHMQNYIKEIRARLEAIQEPKRAELRSRALDSLIAVVRAKRVEEAGDHAFLDVYNAWMWFVGTFKVERHATLGRPHLPMWSQIGHRDRPEIGTMFGEAPEVIEALRAAFNTLQLALQRGSAGN